ncbi:MAG: hypothetical protein ACK5GV_11935 [Bacteroidota bacterium]|jgi:hypothetical protein
MKKSTVLANLLKETKNKKYMTARTAAALDWNRKNISKLFEDKSYKVSEPAPSGAKIGFGNIYAFQYIPKNKDTLPYYDRFPLALMIEPSTESDGVLGINFHYLSPTKRAQFMLALYDFEEQIGKQKNTKLNVSYSDLVSNYALRFYKPCIKLYLLNHIVPNPFYKVPSDEWNMMLFLPTQRFVKATDTKVWRASARMAG